MLLHYINKSFSTKRMELRRIFKSRFSPVFLIARSNLYATFAVSSSCFCSFVSFSLGHPLGNRRFNTRLNSVSYLLGLIKADTVEIENGNHYIHRLV